MLRRRAILLVMGAGLTVAPVANAKISVPLGGRILHVGQRIELRVPGCSSGRSCRWAADTRIVLTAPYDRHHPAASMRTIARLGVVSPYGMLRFRVPRVTTGTYSVAAIWPHLGWARSGASAPFTIEA